LLFAGPGVRAGQADHGSLASLADLLPTFCDCAGVQTPEGVRGVSLRAALEGSGSVERPYVVGELLYESAAREGRMLRSRRYKYICFQGGARPEQLFDLELDPGETRNLVADPGAAEALHQHRHWLREWIRRTADDFRPPV
jgi:arylsulfatase A-like enzyme